MYVFINLLSLSRTQVKCISPLSSSKLTWPALWPELAEDDIAWVISANTPLNGLTSALLEVSITEV